MQAIWKFPLTVMDDQDVVLPKGSVILTVQVQNERPTLWAQVNPDVVEAETRRIHIVGTGHLFEVIGSWRYIGTFQLLNGDFVGHVYEVEA